MRPSALAPPLSLMPMAFAPSLSLSAPTVSPFSRLRHSDLDLDLPKTILGSRLKTNPCARFGPDRPSRLADYKEYTDTQIDIPNGKYYMRCSSISLKYEGDRFPEMFPERKLSLGR